MVTHQSSHPAGDGHWGQPQGTLRVPWETAGASHLPWAAWATPVFLKVWKCFGLCHQFVVTWFCFHFSLFRKKRPCPPHARSPLHLPPALRSPRGLPRAVGSIPVPQGASSSAEAGHAAHPCQGASDLRLLNAASLLRLRWPTHPALGGRRAQSHAATESRPRIVIHPRSSRSCYRKVNRCLQTPVVPLEKEQRTHPSLTS